MRAIAAVMVGELGLPLPRQFTVFVYPTRSEYEQGLVREGTLSPTRAAEIAEYSVGLGQHRRLFVNDEAFRGGCRSAWLGVVAHELTHAAQYELSGGRRGRSEQWLREGMADWVTFRLLERLGEGTFAGHRKGAMAIVRQALPVLQERPLDLVDLGRPAGWEAQALRTNGRLAYQLAFLLTDDLIRHQGFDRLLEYFRSFADSDDRLRHFQQAFGLSVAEFGQDALRRIRQEIEREELTPVQDAAAVISSVTAESRLMDEAEQCPADLIDAGSSQ
ncbi:MAG: hypothetical protein HY726_00520 [Candidatus Rokubacteria bacterium]|nr:hypothetical protein [Candidatus Rokubacteria bacterium]